MPIHFIAGMFILITGLINNQESIWKLELDKEGIQVFTRHVEGSNFKEFRSDVIIEGNITEIAEIITDIEKFSEWCYKTKSTKLIRKEGNTVRYFYVSDTPKFLKTRVAYFESETVTSTHNNEITITLNNFNCDEPIPENSLLIPVMKGFWKLTPINEKKVHVMMQMLTEPGGIIPAWLANMVVVDSPNVTLTNLRKRIAMKIQSKK